MSSSSSFNLLQAAATIRLQAYAPYSKFQVGAALLTETGRVFTGCNVENASYGLTICAERSAVFAAVAEGERNFTDLVVASPGGVMPCGACLQVLSEFSDELRIFLLNAQDPEKIIETSLDELLPRRFKLKNA